MNWHERWSDSPTKREYSGMGRMAALLLMTLAFAPARSLAVVPCPARIDAVIANTGKVVSSEHSLVDSYNSTLGGYGGTNVGSQGTVRAAGPVVRRGIINGPVLEHSPAMLPEIPVSPIARPLPLGARVPGRLKLDGHQILTLKPGDYVAAGIDLDWPAEIRVAPIGHVRIFVTGRLSIRGGVNLHGRTEDLELILTRIIDPGAREDNDPLVSFLRHLLRFLFPNPHEVEIREKGSLTGLLYAPKSEVYVDSEVFGEVVGATVRLERRAAVHYDVGLVCPTASSVSTATPPPALPAPPPPVVGCYMNTRNGWQNIPCAIPADLADFPKPQVADVQLTVTGLNTIPLVFGQIDVTIPQISTITDVLPGSPSTANAFSLQSTTNQFPVPGRKAIASGEYAGDVQFTIQSNGKNSAICIWNIGVLLQRYLPTCLTLCPPVAGIVCLPENPPQRPGGLQPFDYGNIAAQVNSNGTLSMVAELSWVQSGQPNQFAVVAPDMFGLAGQWTEMSGGLLGEGSGSEAQLTNAEVVTQVLAASCPGDTQAGSPICAPPALQPMGEYYIGGNGTLETNNLISVAPATLSYLNQDLEVGNVTASTSGSCLGQSHAYIKDSPQDFGATPSTLGNQVSWESPDIFVVPQGTAVDVNAVSVETTITPGLQYDVYVRVHNDLGCSDVTGAKSLVYLADPSALSVQWDSITGNNYVGNNMSATGVTVPAGGQALIGPLTFTAPATGIGNGHKCLLAAIEADGEPAPAKSTDAPDSNQVGQRNLEFVGPCVFQLTNGTTSDGTVQISLTAAPNSNTPPSLTVSPDIEVTFDDTDSSWFNAWSGQAGNGTAFSLSHNGGANSTTVRLGTFSVVLNPVPLPAGQSRNATGNVNPTNGTLTLQLGAMLTDAGGQMLANNGGSCTVTANVIQ
jgi:hypothetical protein